MEECIDAVEEAFKLHAEGKAAPPGILGIHTLGGGFHIKTAILSKPTPSGNPGRSYFVAKANANFPQNMKYHGLPTIQGVIVVCDATNGRLLALMDSMEITVVRTGAATAVATKYLARVDAKIVTICGCGNQGRISLKMLMKVRPLQSVFVFDIDNAQARKFAYEISEELEIAVEAVDDLAMAVRRSDIVVTCTPSKQPFLRFEDVMPGTFIAAVGSDSEDKQELEPELVSSGKLVVDLLEQCATIGELHHSLERGLMKRNDVHAELGEIIAGRMPGRTSNEEIIVFDSTGTALQDVAAAVIVYEKALQNGVGVKLNFAQ